MPLCYNNSGDLMDGILFVNKPAGITSYDVIRQAKKIFKTKKIGHTGTLDPFAEGLLILCVNKATKLVSSFLNANKTYEGIISLGSHYDTYDTTGKIIDTNTPNVSNKQLKAVLESFKGEYYQEPPMYSAIKKDGKKMYEYARAGIEVERSKRLVEIINIELIEELNNNEFKISVEVSKGTYIRSLAVDIAKKLKTFGALKTLKRTKIGNYSIDNSINLDKLKQEDLILLTDFWDKLPRVKLNDYLIKLVKNGVYLDERQTDINRDFVVVNEADQIIAYYDVTKNNQYKPIIMLGENK